MGRHNRGGLPRTAARGVSVAGAPTVETARARQHDGGNAKRGKAEAVVGDCPNPLSLLAHHPHRQGGGESNALPAKSGTTAGRRTRRDANIARSSAATATRTDHQKISRTANAITTKNGKVGAQSGYARKSESILRSTTSAPNDGVGVWKQRRVSSGG